MEKAMWDMLSADAMPNAQYPPPHPPPPGKPLKDMSGTIRGKKHGVRSALSALQMHNNQESELLQRLRQEEQQCVVG